MRSRLLVATLVSAALLTVAARADHHESDLMKEVTALGDRLAAAMLADDVETMLSMYAPDAISLPNFEPRMDGVDNFRKRHAAMVAAGVKILSFESDPTDVLDSGEHVIEIGKYTISVEMPGMPSPMDDQGKYLTIYSRDDEGALEIQVETWNTDVDPMQMMGAGHEHGGEHGGEHGHDAGHDSGHESDHDH